MRFVSVPPRQLNAPVSGDDRRGMIDFEMELVHENPSWIAVLKAYQAAQAELAAQQAEAAEQSAKTAKLMACGAVATGETSEEDSNAASPEDDDSESSEGEEMKSSGKRAPRWVERITKLPEIEREELSRIHGRLIAYDLLKCDLAGRSSGMVYQLTSGGKEILRRLESDELADAA